MIEESSENSQNKVIKCGSNNKDCDKAEQDPEIDIFSHEFNPKKYLNVQPKELPAGSQFNNFAALEAIIKEHEGRCTDEIFRPKIRKPKVKNESLPSGSSFNTEDRRFLPHQMPVTKPIKSKYCRNLLTRIDEGYKGPLGQLKYYMDNKLNVLIYIRKEHGVRGTITGSIEAFDKHWNMVIKNATEVWTKRKRYYTDQNVLFTNSISKDKAENMLTRMGITLPFETIKSIDRKHVKCTRIMAQLMVRGEQIVLVTRDEENKNKL